jgi:hypothetical protein
LENPKCRNPDDACQHSHYHCGTRRNSGLCWPFVVPLTLETPKCRIPTPWDLATPVIVSDQRLPSTRKIVIRDLASHKTLTSPNTEPRSPMYRFLIRYHLDSPFFQAPLCHVTSGFRGSRILDTKFPAVGNPERRNPDSSDSCHLSFQRSTAPMKSRNR